MMLITYVILYILIYVESIYVTVILQQLLCTACVLCAVLYIFNDATFTSNLFSELRQGQIDALHPRILYSSHIVAFHVCVVLTSNAGRLTDSSVYNFNSYSNSNNCCLQNGRRGSNSNRFPRLSRQCS